MVGHHRFERRPVPEIERIDRLHVIVSVEQHARTGVAVALGDDRRMAGGRPHVGGKPERSDVFRQMVGGLLAIAGEGGIGRDRFNAKQGE